MDFYVPLFLILPFLLGKKTSKVSTSKSTTSEYLFPDVEKVRNVPFAMGTAKPKWPLITKNSRGREVPYLTKSKKYIGNPSRSFGVLRSDGDRYHVGLDLYCDLNDVVVAMESGTVVNTQGFLGPTKALLIQGKSGLVVLYGEIKNNSWDEFGIKEGSVVKAGDPIARIGMNDAGTHMLHLETYAKDTTQNISWPSNKPVNPSIKNPTKYLLQAQKYDLS